MRWPQGLSATALALAAAIWGVPLGAQTLTISSRVDKPGYSDIGGRVVTEAFRRAGIGLVYKPLPLSRAVEEANDGVTDGDIHRVAAALSMYPDLIAVPTAVNRIILAVYGRSPEIRTMTRDQISRLKIGYSRGSLVERKFTSKMNVTQGGLLSETFEMLANGRVDALILDHLDAEALLFQNQTMRRPPMWPYIWASEPRYLVLNKRNAALIPRLDAALVQMKREGLIDGIYEDAMRAMNVAPLLTEKVDSRPDSRSH